MIGPASGRSVGTGKECGLPHSPTRSATLLPKPAVNTLLPHPTLLPEPDRNPVLPAPTLLPEPARKLEHLALLLP